MTAFLDVCRFNPTAGGTTDFIVASPVTGYQTPAAAGAVNGKTYRYRAESADLTQWEVGLGTYTSGTATLARTTVLFNSSGTTAKINFSAAPQVAIVALAEDLLSMTETQSAGTFLAGPTSGAAAAPAFRALQAPQRTVLASGSGTYTTPAGALWLEVEMVGGGGGASGNGNPGGTTGGAGGNTTFGTAFLIANGGAPGPLPASTTAAAGGTASGGDINTTGGSGEAPGANPSGTTAGFSGGVTPFGGAGAGGAAGANAGQSATANSGSGGGGPGGTSGVQYCAGGGAAGGYLRKLITTPAGSYSYAVGAGGTAGTAGTNGAAGGSGGSGIIIVTAHFQ